MKRRAKISWWVGVAAFVSLTAAIGPAGAQEVVAMRGQNSPDNSVRVSQIGTLNDATTLQGFLTGECNDCVLDLAQIGDGNASYLAQDGIDNYSAVLQEGDLNNIEALQNGSGNFLNFNQFNSGNVAVLHQYGDGHWISVSQPGDAYIEITQE